MDATQNLKLSLGLATQIRTSNKQKDIGQALCTVVKNISGNIFLAELPDGSERTFRYLGNAGLAIGSQISITSTDLAVISYGDTPAR